MATFGSYTINGPSLLSATTVFGPSPATTAAPDGFYSDGTNVRQQISGVLQPTEACPSCEENCNISVSATGTQGVFTINVGIGTGTTGAVVLNFTGGTPCGILATYNGNTFNTLSSQGYGYMNTGVLSNLPIYVGGPQASICETSPGSGVPIIPCVAPCTTLSNVVDYIWDGAYWVGAGGTTSLTIPATQDATTVLGGGGTYTMVIPKNNLASTVSVSMYAVCPNPPFPSGSGFTLTVNCPVALPSTLTTGYDVANAITACADATVQTLYRGKVNGTDALPGLHDFVYTDNQGVTPATAGIYKYDDGGVNKWFRVSADGVIDVMGNC